MSQQIDYFDNDIRLEGVLFPTEDPANSPIVLVVPTYAGRDDFTLEKAKMMNQLGFSGFAVDMYGEGKTGSTPEENMELMQAVLDDREMLQRRIKMAHQTAIDQVGVNTNKSAAIGFCFGGLCVLDLARTGSSVAGVVSFHGLFNPPGNTDGNKISSKILVLHGNDDPMVPHESVNGLANELTAVNADWQIHAYGGTSHALQFQNCLKNIDLILCSVKFLVHLVIQQFLQLMKSVTKFSNLPRLHLLAVLHSEELETGQPSHHRASHNFPIQSHPPLQELFHGLMCGGSLHFYLHPFRH